MLLSLSSAMRARGGGHANTTNTTNTTNSSSNSTNNMTPTRNRGSAHEASSSSDVVVGETPEGVKRPPTNVGVGVVPSAIFSAERTSTGKKQRSIHDFFGSQRMSTTPTTILSAITKADRKPRARATRRSNGHAGSSSGSSRHDSEELIKKRIDYDDTSSLDENDDDEDEEVEDGDEVDMMEDALSLSQNSEAVHGTPTPQPVKRAMASSLVSVVRPKRIDFGGICPSSQRSEPDVEPTNNTVVNSVVEPPSGHQSDSVVRASSLSQSASQYGGYGGYSAYGGGMFSQDDLDFCTPADQPVVHMSHPTTPSPLKKRPRRSFGDDDDLGTHMIHEDLQNLTDDMTHMDVRKLGATSTARVRGAQALAPLPSFSSSSDSNDLLLATPQRVLGLPTGFKGGKRKDSVPPSLANGSNSLTPFVLAKGGKAPPPPSSSTAAAAVESFTNPFAPVPAVDSRKRRKFRQSFPPSLGGSSMSVPYSRYLSEFVEQELLGSGAFSKVFKCVKKIDGWTYAIKKSKRHLRGRNDTERALREVQALAALSDSRHIVRYFDAWIEDDLLYIQLEHCASCSLATFVDAHKPLHVPEETLCKVLCHLAMALQDLHAKQMVHLDVKLPNVLIAPGEIYKLGDLGTVALADGAMDITEGDNRYLSRELLEGSRANLKASDVFALGATIYELALGATLPTGGEEWQKIRDGDLALFRQYTNSLQHLIASMMHPDPLQRPAADEILQHEVVRPYCH